MIRACLLLLLLLAPVPVLAQAAERLDDSASQVLSGLVRMKWEHPAPGAGDALVGQVTVLVRIDTSAQQGRSGRIFHVLKGQATPVEASWTTRGVLLPGQVKDGERTLVYAGPITSPMMEDTFVLTIRADANLLSKPEQLEFHFEFEGDGA